MELIVRSSTLVHKMRWCLLGCLILLPAWAHAQVVREMRTSVMKGPQLVMSDSRIVSLGRAVRPEDVLIATNHSAAMWAEREPNGAVSRVFVLQGKRTREVQCYPRVRDYWFVGSGALIGLDCGGLHFAGKEILLTTANFKKIDEFDQAIVPPESRPSWSSSGEGEK